jgi:ribosomal protein S30
MSKSKPNDPKRVKTIPIDQIRFLNPRVRNRRNFQEIVQSIAQCRTQASDYGQPAKKRRGLGKL